MKTLKNFLSLDIGSTCCKAQMFDEEGNILFYRTSECPLTGEGGEAYADILLIRDTIKSLIREAAGIARIHSLAFSSFGESFVLLDGQDRILTLPMLYTDARGRRQAERVARKYGKDEIYRLTGVMPHAMFSVYKLLWIMENQKERYACADKLFLIGDYFGYLLTGKRAIDYSLASRTGAFDVRAKKFAEEFLKELDIPRALFSSPMPAGSVVGTVLPEAADEYHLPRDCVLVLGSHDQICASLGACALEAGAAVDGMGTVECLTVLFDRLPEDPAFGAKGYPFVPYAVDGLYCTYVLNTTCGSVVNWFRKKIVRDHRGEEENFFAYMEKRMGDTPSEVLLLPYFAGAATPRQDENAKGAFLNLTLGTQDADLYRAILEGAAYEMRLNMNAVGEFGIAVREAIATGGGAKSDRWLQIKADVQGIPYYALRSAEGGLCGLALLQAVAAGSAKDLPSAAKIFVKRNRKYLPQKQEGYERNFEKYRKLYDLLKEIN